MNTLLVGLDAASPEILDRLRAENAIPTLESVWEAGASGTLESQIPPWTASAWPSLYTGKNPGKHGVFGFLHFEGYEWSVVNGSHVRELSLWEILNDHGHSSVVVNVPVTHPPREFDGALLPGYTAPEDPTCHPEGLFHDVVDCLGEYRIYAPADVTEAAEQQQWHQRLSRMRGAAFRHLASEYDPDFGFLQFQQTDTVFHQTSRFDAVRDVYETVDAEVRKTLDDCDPDHVILASDHGIGEYRGVQCRVNELLRDEGYVAGKQGGRGMPTWVTVRDESLRAGTDDRTRSQGLLARAVAGLSKVGLTTDRIAATLERVGLAEPVAKRVPLSVSRAGTEQVDFPESRAYVRDRIELGVRLNLEGREPSGTVPQAEYETVRRELIRSLSALQTPDGESLFEEVAPREKYFHGPAASNAVDVVTVPANFDHLLSSSLGGSVFESLSESWHHKLEGMIAATGPRVLPDEGVGDAHLFDVAPTVLATFELPYGDRMDGSPLPCVRGAGTRSYAPVTDRSRVASADGALEDRLADLGYLEKP